MSTLIRGLMPALLVAVVAAPSQAQQSPLNQVPAKAPIVIHLRGWERTLERVKAAIKAVAPDQADAVSEQIDTALAGVLMGRELKALDKNGPLFFVFTEFPTGDDDFRDIALVARVTNYVQFRDALLKDDEKKELKAKDGFETTKIDNEAVYFIERDSFAIVALNEKGAKMFLDKKAGTLAAKLDRTVAGKVLDADVSAYVDMKAVNKQFGDQIDSFKMVIDQAIEQIQMTGALEKDLLPLVKKLYDGIFRLVEDCEGLVVSGEFRSEGFMLRLHTQVGEKSKSNELLRTFKPSPLEGITKLPVGQMSYITGATGLDWMKNLMGLLTMGLGGNGTASSDNQAVADAAKALANLKVGNWSASSDVPMGGVQVAENEDPAKFLDAAIKLYRNLPEQAMLGAAVIKGKPEVKQNAESLKGVSFHSLKVTWDLDKTLEKYPEDVRELNRTMLTAALGKELNSWIGASGKTVVQVFAKDWAEAKKLLTAYFEGKSVLAGNADYLATRKQLPADASLLVLIDAARYGQYLAKTIGEMMKKALGGAGGGEVKPAEGKSSYIGLAVVLQPRHGSMDVWIPMDAVKTLVKMLAPLFRDLDG